MTTQAGAIISLLFFLMSCVFAPVPRCSFFLFINKVPESNSLTSDMNPLFPVPPCEYGGPMQAIMAGDYEAVFVLAHPEKIPLHNIHEAVWAVKTGYARLQRILAGKEEFKLDTNILMEGYGAHHTGKVRTEQLGQGTHRNPEDIDDFDQFKAKIQKLCSQEKRKRRK